MCWPHRGKWPTEIATGGPKTDREGVQKKCCSKSTFDPSNPPKYPPISKAFAVKSGFRVQKNIKTSDFYVLDEIAEKIKISDDEDLPEMTSQRSKSNFYQMNLKQNGPTKPILR